jgi:4-(gamma-glutamylamino)butanal dehydrogenase
MEQSILDTLRATPVAPQTHLIDGQTVDASDGQRLDVVSPIDGQSFGSIAQGTPQDMERAISTARAAFEDRRWVGQPPAARKKVLMKWADLIEQEALSLAVLGVRDNGTEIRMALNAEPLSAVGTIRYYAEAIDKINGEIAPTADDVLALVHREAVGVVGAIIPWNFPLMIGAWKIAPALAVGNSVVVKPAEGASLSTLRMVQLAHEAGLPPGVLNVVTGEGSVVGETLAMSMDVDVLAFTGSGSTGRRLLEYSARSNLKRVYLELGGKSPNIVFADAPDLDEAARMAVTANFRNSGQVCISGSRLLVEASIHDDFVAAVARSTEELKVGDPLNLNNTVGAVHSATQLEQNLRYLEGAKSDGFDVITGGKQLHADSGGYYLAPSVVTKVTEKSTLAQEEVFGPVLAVTPFENDAEAVRLANSTIYGLSGGIWTSSLSRAHRMVRQVKSGMLHVNTYGGSDNTIPMGGIGQSGNGHDKSLHALDKYVDLKSAWIKI